MKKHLCITLLLCGAAAWAEPVELTHNQLRLNGELRLAGTSPGGDTPLFLIVHGTWAHHGMEIISALQSILAENGQPSLAITLSLGIDDREGFLGCDAPVTATQEAALPEIGAWLNKLQQDGWRRIILVGHSRGGAQAARFQQQNAPPAVSRLVLLAPMLWGEAQTHADYDARSPVPLSAVLEEARTTAAAQIGPYPLLSCASVEAAPASILSYYDPPQPPHTPSILAALSAAPGGHVPVDIYLGSADTYAAWEADDVAAIEGRPGISLHRVEGADHFFRDLYLYDVVDDLLARLP